MTLIKAIIAATRKNVQIRNYYCSMKAKKSSNSAKVATARSLLKIVYRVWKENKFYRVEKSKIAPTSF